jgi:hypothetical protein
MYYILYIMFYYLVYVSVFVKKHYQATENIYIYAER